MDPNEEGQMEILRVLASKYPEEAGEYLLNQKKFAGPEGESSLNSLLTNLQTRGFVNAIFGIENDDKTRHLGQAWITEKGMDFLRDGNHFPPD